MATKLAHIREATFAPDLHLATADDLYLFIKRLFDVFLSAVLLLAFAPLMALISLVIILDSPGPVIFRQKRVFGGQSWGDDNPEKHVFEFYKFRSMYQDADQKLHQQYMQDLINGHAKCVEDAGKKMYKLGRDPRISRVGLFLRKASLDELPQLVNILRGEMSFVGPRPAIPYEVRQYKPWHLQRLTVTQGLTGLWQVSGRNELSFDEMVQLDVEYGRKRSLLLDFKILLATIPAVLNGRGVR